MDKKVSVSILFSFLVLVGLIGITNAIVSSDNATDMLGAVNMSLQGDGYGLDNSTKGGVSEIVNLTIFYGNSSTVGEHNISNITITWSSASNFTFLGWVSGGDEYNGACDGPLGGSSDACGYDIPNASGSPFFSNVTLISASAGVVDTAIGDWNCTNRSTTILNCFNNTAGAALSSDNDTIMIRFNVTAANSIEDREIFNITVEAGGDADSLNTTSLTTYIDGIGPRLVELNISDGNTTWGNGTFNGTVGSGFATYLDSGSQLTVTATVYEQTPDQATSFLYWNASDVNSDVFSPYTLLPRGNTTEVTPTIVVGPLGGVDDNTFYAHQIKYTWTIPANSIVDEGVGGAKNNSVAFVLHFNDTYNADTVFNDTSVVTTDATDLPFTIMVNDTLPYVFNISLSDAQDTTREGAELVNGVSDYLSGSNITIRIDVSGMPRPTNTTISNNSNIYLYYNTTGALTSETNGIIKNFDRLMDLGDANITALDTNVPTDIVSYETSIDMTGNGTNDVEMYIVIGNKTADLDQGATNSPGNYTTNAFFKFTVDADAPAVALSTPSIRGISTSDSIEYTCTGTESSGSGVAAYRWTLTKPDGSTEDFGKVTSSSTTNPKIFSGNNIAVPGRYSVMCSVYDDVNNRRDVSTTTSNDFTVSISSTGGGASSGGGSGAAVSFDVDFTSVPKATLKASQGRIKSFSFDGITKHTITFNEVTATSATLVIASNPVTITLNVGQSKEADINNDGVNDIKVTLNSIANGVADITIEEIEAGVEIMKKEEREARGLPPTEEAVTPVVAGSLAWLWWTLLVIVVIIVVGYVVNKRK